MKKFKALPVLVVLFVLACFGMPVYANDNFVIDGVESIIANNAESQPDKGRPDPTNRGRYTEYGSEVVYAGAEILPEGTAGVECNKASEMVGATVWNTTKPGFAIKTVLSDKAEIALVNGKMYLCHCAKGYNRLFLEERPVETQPIVKAAEARVKRDGAGNITVTVENNLTLPTYEQPQPALPQPPQPVLCRDEHAKNNGQPGDCRYSSNTWKWVAGGAILTGAAVYYFVTKDDHRGPDVDTKGKCIATSYPNNCPKSGAPGVGVSSMNINGFGIGYIPGGFAISVGYRPKK